MKNIPKHIAIIMDGNGRWAKKRLLPRVAGHVKGTNTLKKIVYHCNAIGVKHLTVFAFGRENWQRPQTEVSFLMRLMLKRLAKELDELHQQNGRICFLGDRTRISKELLTQINIAEEKTQHNSGLNFNICLDYSGQYDILQAVNQIISSNRQDPLTEEEFAKYLLTQQLPNPELLIRTGNENRISNFMLWQVAYSEIYFSEKAWPDFSPNELDNAIIWFNSKERRFGKISEQIKEE